MNPRNMLGNNGMIEFAVAHQMQSQQHPESYILMGSPPNFPQSSVHQILLTSGSIQSQYPHQMHPVTNLELGIPSPSNFYYPYLNLASGPSGHTPMDQLPSYSNFGAIAAHGSGYGMNGFAPEGFQGLSKINGPEGFMGNIQYFNAPSAPTVLVPPMNVGPIDGRVAIIDACNPMRQYRGNYVGPFFHPLAVTWCERQPNGVGDGSNLPFNCLPMSPYFEAPASSVDGIFSEIGNTGLQRFHEGASTSRGSLNLLPYTPMRCLYPLKDIHPQNIQGPERVNYHPPIATTSSSRPINNTVQYAGISHPQQGPERVAPPHGMRIYRSHRRNVTPGGVHRHHNLHHLRLLPEEDVAILEFSGQYDMSSTIDHLRDMQLDTNYMSYEELLALSERIGHVKTGLSEEAINTHLKTRVRVSSLGTKDLEELPCSDDKKDSCVICQDEYEDDIIGSLDCGHEYHVDCLKQWLLLKNVCTICKSTALKVEHEWVDPAKPEE